MGKAKRDTNIIVRIGSNIRLLSDDFNYILETTRKTGSERAEDEKERWHVVGYYGNLSSMCWDAINRHFESFTEDEIKGFDGIKKSIELAEKNLTTLISGGKSKKGV